MNTRLQVEHAITEAITGLDLVEEMINIANNNKLQYDQEQIAKPKGWSFECRVYAEDPQKGYLPSTGSLKTYQEPPAARIDTGVAEGSEVSMWYDAMISKVSTHGSDRPTALQKMREALDSYAIRGVQNNIPLLRSCLDRDDFVTGKTPTSFLKSNFPDESSLDCLHFPLAESQSNELVALAAAQFVWHELWISGSNINPVPYFGPEQNRSFHISSNLGNTYDVQVRPASHAIRYKPEQDCPSVALALEIQTPSEILIVEPLASDNLPGIFGLAPIGRVLLNGKETVYQTIAKQPRTIHLQYCGVQRKFVIDYIECSPFTSIMPLPIEQDGSSVIASPMPGVIIDVLVSLGDIIGIGDEVAVIEAMKMQNIVKATFAGKISSIKVSKGDHIAAEAPLVQVEVL